MTSPTRRARRAAALPAALSTAVLVGALLPLGLATPAHADAACTTEVPQGGGPLGPLTPGTRCDDQVPPVATLDSVSPAPNQAGYVNTDSLTFTFSGSHAGQEADTDAIGFECQFYATAAEPAQWQSCTSPATYTDLADTTSVPWTFRVRAFDAADRQIDATAATNPLFGTGGAETDLPDVQASPVSSVVKIDTRPPQTYIFNTPYDAESPDLPMLLTDSPQFRLASSEGGTTYDCTIEGETFPCHDGNTTFRDLGPGDKTLVVGATDRAGNVDPDPATTRFTVPEDIGLPAGKQGAKWQERTAAKAFGGSFIETTRYGARFQVSGDGVREVRLLGTTGPDVGLLKYKVPGGPWIKVKMNAKVQERNAVVFVRKPTFKSFSGPLKFKVFSRGRPVAVDAIMLR